MVQAVLNVTAIGSSASLTTSSPGGHGSRTSWNPAPVEGVTFTARTLTGRPACRRSLEEVVNVELDSLRRDADHTIVVDPQRIVR